MISKIIFFIILIYFKIKKHFKKQLLSQYRILSKTPFDIDFCSKNCNGFFYIYIFDINAKSIKQKSVEVC